MEIWNGEQREDRGILGRGAMTIYIRDNYNVMEGRGGE